MTLIVFPGVQQLKPVRSPLLWMGGKYHMAQFILSAFPDASCYDVYVEPFVGACHVLAQKPVQGHYEVVNSLFNYELLDGTGWERR